MDPRDRPEGIRVLMSVCPPAYFRGYFRTYFRT